MIAAVVSQFCLRKHLTATLAGALFSALVAGPALAQSGSWNVDADGLWSGTSNWLNGTIGQGVGGTATFANNITATRTVTLDTNKSLGRFVFGDADTSSAASWIVSGTNSMTMNSGTNSATITVNALGTGATATISAVLLSSATTPSIIKDGVGTLVLTATNNNFTNKLAITSGTLQVSADRNLGGVGTFATDRITISNGAALRTTAAFTLNAARGITIGSGSGTINVNGGSLTIAAPLAGSGNTATVTGSSAVVLQNTSGTATNVNWDFAANNGIRAFFEGANALGTGSVRVRNGIRLTSQSMTTGTLTNAVTLDSGAGLTARSTGGAQTYTNVIFPSTGTVVFNKDDQATSNLTITSGGTLAGSLTIDTSPGGSNPVNSVFLDGVFSGAGGFVKSGTGATGSLVLRGANTFTGNTTINTGTLRLGTGGSITSSGTISVASEAVFDTNTGFSLATTQWLQGSGTVLGNVSALGTIAPGASGSAGTLFFANSPALGSGSVLSYGLNGADTTAGGGINDLSSVASNLTLDGTLNVSEIGAGSFLSATQGSTWRLFDYTGNLTDNGLSLGTTPALSPGLNFSVDTSTPNQVNLIVVPEPAVIAPTLFGLVAVWVVRARRRRATVGA